MRDAFSPHHFLLCAILALPGCTSPLRNTDDTSSGAPGLTMPEEALRHFPGRYRLNSETGIRIERQGDRLFLEEFGGVAHELHYVGDDRYQRREVPTPVTFTTEQERSSGWAHTVATVHFILDDGSRRTHRRIPGDEITPREVLISEGYESALPVYRRLVGESPDDPHLSERRLIESGLKMAAAERFEPAIGLLRVAAELYPDSAEARTSVGRVYRHMGWPHAAKSWYRRSLDVDPDFPSALKAHAELQAERTADEHARTTRASAGRLALTIRALIDGCDLLKVRGDRVWFEHISRARPGSATGDTDVQPTVVNGEAWTPQWNGRISDFLDVNGGIWPLDVWHVSYRAVDARGSVVVVEQASEANDFTFTLMLDDEELPGAAWYEVELLW